MASVLVPVDDVVAFLGDVEADDTASLTALETLIDQVEAGFLSACGRPERPFLAAAAGRTEVHDGNGLMRLWLDYPIADVTSVTLGFDTTDPDETLSVDDRTELIWRVGDPRLTRIDGGTFGCEGQPDYVTVVYDHQGELPEDAALAITRVVAAIWRQRGSEDTTAERVGPYDATFAAVTRDDPLWSAAVRAHRTVHT